MPRSPSCSACSTTSPWASRWWSRAAAPAPRKLPAGGPAPAGELTDAAGAAPNWPRRERTTGGPRHGREAARHHHERRDRAHGHEPAPRALDRRHPRRGRRGARETATASCPTRSWSAATRRKIDALAKAHGIARYTTDLDAALADTNDTVFFDAATTQMRPDAARARPSPRASTSIARSRSPPTSRRRSASRARPRPPASSTASCRTSCSCPACASSRC